jgi:CheY-like chemotaxis protein
MNKPLTGCRILVVEDEMLLSLTLKDMLVDLGCSSVTATETTEKALSLIAGKTFDAAVLDMNLKGESSRSVAEALAARNVPFVVTTGNRLMWDGFDGPILRKPFKYSELAEVLACLLPR